MEHESQLIAATVAGQAGYEQLVERYHVGLIIHCDRLVDDRDDAEDIAQEAFIKAYQKLASFDAAQARFSTWLYRIATNLCIDHLRRNKHRVNVNDVEALAGATMPTHLQDELKAEVQAAVLGLMPPEYRKAIEGYYWHGKSYQQLAEELNVPINTVRTWLRRGKAQLRQQLS
jgi:RNA polymerase sigma-70 factor (ECF subfamily)